MPVVFDDCMCQSGPGGLELLVSKISHFINDIGSEWFLEGLSFDLICSFIAITNSNEVIGRALH